MAVVQQLQLRWNHARSCCTRVAPVRLCVCTCCTNWVLPPRDACLLHGAPSHGAATRSPAGRDCVMLVQVRAVGVCNYNAGQVEEMHGLLAKHGIPLASNQARTAGAVQYPPTCCKLPLMH